MSSERWIESEPAEPLVERGPALTASQVSSWRERGFALVHGLFPEALIAQARRDALVSFGTEPPSDHADFGSQGRMEFPTPSAAVNALTLHPRLLTALSQLLSVPVSEVRLTQSDLWPKYGRKNPSTHPRDNRDQRIHVDYPNHTLLHPPRWHEPEAVELIVYLSDVGECGGPTAVVPREGPDDPAYEWPIVKTPGVGALPWVNDRLQAEQLLREEAPDVARWRAEHLYPRERYVRYRVGTALLYRHDTWHRGTPLDIGALRLVQNMTFRKAASEWISVLHTGWTWAMYRRSQVMERIVATSSVQQRCVLGFPSPGDAFWTEDHVAAIEARYGPLGMDVAPYRRGS
ncbi:MAG: hypothetical protein P8R42_18255 [Candidatus Binatia bacterium]|nr:hypothetical protein [Candidatus Binatia bacterium]